MLCRETGRTCERSDCFPYDEGGCWRGSLRQASDSQEIMPSAGDGSNPEVQEIMPRNQLEVNESARRKASPVFSGVLNYFPDALMAVARVSKAGNDKHNPGQPLHWSRDKSNDHLDCAARHLLTPYAIDPDSKEVHLANAVWRLLAELQLHEETYQALKAKR